MQLLSTQEINQISGGEQKDDSCLCTCERTGNAWRETAYLVKCSSNATTCASMCESTGDIFVGCKGQCLPYWIAGVIVGGTVAIGGVVAGTLLLLEKCGIIK